MKKRGNVERGLIVLIFLVLLLLNIALYYNLISKPKSDITGFAIENKSLTNAIAIRINIDEEIGVVREDFYGTNTHGRFLGKSAQIDVYNNGTLLNGFSDYQWHRNAFLESNMGYIRMDSYLEMYSNEDGTFKPLFSERSETVKWAYENNKRVLLIMGFTPQWLANKSHPGCDGENKWYSCPPDNLTEWQVLINNTLLNLSNNHEYDSIIDIEVLNEPYGGGWLGLYEDNNLEKALKYVELYNATYLGVKSYNKSILVGGPSGFRDAPVMTETFLSNMTKNMDFVSIHPYADNGKSYIKSNQLIKDITELQKECEIYNANCSRIIISEWNEIENAMKKTASRREEFAANIAFAYQSLLNYLPNNISSTIYQWAERRVTGSYYTENNTYQQVVEPILLSDGENSYYPSYNITKDFATYHASGSMIVNSSSSNSSVVAIASFNESDILHITLIMTGSGKRNVSIDLSSTDIQAIRDLQTKDIYIVFQGFANIGELNQYEVRHYESYNIETEQKETNESEITKNETNENNTEENKTKESEIIQEINLNNNIKEIGEIEENNTEKNNTQNTSLYLSNKNYGPKQSIKVNTNELIPSSENINANKETQKNADTNNYENENTNLIDENTNAINDNSKPEKKKGIFSIFSRKEDKKTEESESEVNKKFMSNIMEEAKLIQENPIIIVTLLLAIGILTLIIIYIVKKRRKGKSPYNKETINKLEEWIKKAREMGYTDNLMKIMLKNYGWDENLVNNKL